RDLLLIGVLKGAFVFMADLSRHIRLPLEFDFMAISSYGAATHTSGVVRILKDLDHEIAGRNVLVVEDIIDSGLTLSYLLKNLRTRRPASLEVCTLLKKTDVQQVPLDIRYTCFEIPPEFVVGYGLDYAVLARPLPQWPPFPEVPAVLEELRAHGWRLGILSNTDPDFLASSIVQLDMQPDVAITASEIGSYKPAHGHWLAFRERTGA